MLGILSGFPFIRIFPDNIDLARFRKSSNFCFLCLKRKTVHLYQS